MVKIRLRRIGTKGRPYYRVVVAPSTAARNGAFVEVIGTYDPLQKPALINIKEERALHWLRNGAQPSETTAFILSKSGVLEKFFNERPGAKANFKFLDKTTASTSVKSVLEAPAEAKPAKATKVKADEPAEAEAAPEVTAEAAPAVEEPSEPEAAPVVEETVAPEEAPAAEEKAE